MRLLVDSDAFCKLGITNLLSDATGILNAGLDECGRLAALPYMLRRGKLIKVYGEKACADLVPIAKRMPVIPTAPPEWLDKLAPIPDIDPGEAQLFASAAQSALIVVTGDKRALRALKDVSEFVTAMEGRIAALESVLLALCDRMGHDEVRRRIGSLVTADKTLMVCFGSGNPDPTHALESYCRNLTDEVAPLKMWEPQRGDAT